MEGSYSMKIKKIYIDGIHNASNKEYELEDINYLVGPNGSGKSTGLFAIDFALNGTDGRQSSSIYSHSNGKPMTVKLVIEDSGDEIEVIRTLSKTSSKYEENLTITPNTYTVDDIRPQVNLGSINLSLFLSLTANKQKDALISLLPKDNISLNAYDELTGNSLPSDELARELNLKNTQFNSVEDIKKFNLMLKDLLSSKNTDLKRVESTKQSLVFYKDVEMSKSVDEIKQELNDIRDRIYRVKEYSTYLEIIEDKEGEIEKYSKGQDDAKYDTLYKECIDNLDLFQQEFNCILEEKEIWKGKLIDVNKKCENLKSVISTSNTCPTLHITCDKLETHIGTCEKDLVKFSEIADDLKSEIESLESKESHLIHQIEECKNNIKEIDNKRSIKSSLLESLEKAKQNAIRYKTEDSLEKLESQLDALETLLTKTSANEAYNQMASSLIRNETTLKQDITFLKTAIKKTGENGLQTDVMVSSFNKLKDLVNCQLMSLGIDTTFGECKFIVESKANSFKFGIARNDSFIPYEFMSSGEKCIFLIAFMTSLMKLNTAGLSLVCLDDFLDHLDNKNFEQIMTNLKDNDIQAIFAGVKPFSSECIHIIRINR